MLSQQCLANLARTRIIWPTCLMHGEKNLIKRHDNKVDQRNKSVSITRGGEGSLFEHANKLTSE